jgi:hypothetical protein
MIIKKGAVNPACSPLFLKYLGIMREATTMIATIPILNSRKLVTAERARKHNILLITMIQLMILYVFA